MAKKKQRKSGRGSIKGITRKLTTETDRGRKLRKDSQMHEISREREKRHISHAGYCVPPKKNEGSVLIAKQSLAHIGKKERKKDIPSFSAERKTFALAQPTTGFAHTKL